MPSLLVEIRALRNLLTPVLFSSLQSEAVLCLLLTSHCRNRYRSLLALHHHVQWLSETLFIFLLKLTSIIFLLLIFSLS